MTAAPPSLPAHALLRRARALPFLTREEERRLAGLAASGDRAATERLVLGHLQVVVNLARRYGRFGVPFNDLIQEGAIGLLQAVRKFDPERDARLATYALWWVRAAMQDYVVRSWSLVRVGKTAAHKSLFFHLKRPETAGAPGAEDPVRADAEAGPAAIVVGEERLAGLARRFGVPFAEVTQMARRLAGFDQPLDAPLADRLGDEAGANFLDRLADPHPTPEEIAAQTGMARMWSQLIEGGLAMLPTREATIIRRRYLTEAAQTFEAIGRELGLSKDRVRQLERKALERLHAFLAGPAAAHGLPE